MLYFTEMDGIRRERDIVAIGLALTSDFEVVAAQCCDLIISARGRVRNLWRVPDRDCLGLTGLQSGCCLTQSERRVFTIVANFLNRESRWHLC